MNSVFLRFALLCFIWDLGYSRRFKSVQAVYQDDLFRARFEVMSNAGYIVGPSVVGFIDERLVRMFQE